MYTDYEDFFALRLSFLREQKKISARSMSLSIGQNENYINQIESKKTFPSMQGFFYICDYLGVIPEEFFSKDNTAPELVKETVEHLLKLSKKDLSLVCEITKSLSEK